MGLSIVHMQCEWWRRRRRGGRRRRWRRRGKKTDLRWLTVLLAVVEVAGRSCWRRWRCQRWRFSPFLPCFFFSSSFFFLSRFSPLYPYSAPPFSLFLFVVFFFCFPSLLPLFFLFFLSFSFSFSSLLFTFFFPVFHPLFYPPFFSALSSPVFIGKIGEREAGQPLCSRPKNSPRGTFPPFFTAPW